MLLLTHDTAWTTESELADCFLGRESVLLHQAARDDHSCATESSFAVHCNHTDRVALTQLKELLQDSFGWVRAVREVEVSELEACVCEAFLVVACG